MSGKEFDLLMGEVAGVIIIGGTLLFMLYAFLMNAMDTISTRKKEPVKQNYKTVSKSKLARISKLEKEVTRTRDMERKSQVMEAREQQKKEKELQKKEKKTSKKLLKKRNENKYISWLRPDDVVTVDKYKIGGGLIYLRQMFSILRNYVSSSSL